MHPNPAFRQTGTESALQLAMARGFGVLAINGPDGPLTAHVPFILDGTTLRAHLVASNPLWRALADGPLSALVTVSGPDGYVSPDWYDLADQVPTWNYIAVNLRGKLRALPHEHLRGVIEALSDRFEAGLAPKPVWKTDKLPDEVLDRLMRQIRPVAMDIETVESTFKLSQNKPDTAREAAAAEMRNSPIGQETATLADIMTRGTP